MKCFVFAGRLGCLKAGKLNNQVPKNRKEVTEKNGIGRK
jgi:hypothetical protein